MGGLAGCKSNSGIVTDGDGEWDTLAMEEEDFWMEEETLPYQAAATRSMDLLHMDLELGFDWKNQQVIGKAKLRLTPYFYPQKMVVLMPKILNWAG